MKKIYIGLVCVLVVVIGLFGFKLAAQPTKVTPVKMTAGTYVALGDSVAAGVGLTDYSDSSACDRTNQSYPSKLAMTLNYSLSSVACSGATTQDGLIGSQVVNQLTVGSQLSTALSQTKPNLITITIGANDANWTTYIGKCYTGTCGSDSDTAAVTAGIATASTNLASALKQISDKYTSNEPKIVVTGYYKLFGDNPKPNCPELSGVDKSEVLWIAQLQSSIDSSLRTVASHDNFVTYVPLSFSGHELCTDDPWIQGLSGKAAYHPTEQGQASIANQIAAVLKSGDKQ